MEQVPHLIAPTLVLFLDYYDYILDARGVMAIVVGNEHNNTSSILGETDCISYSTNTLGKGMNLIILPPAMGK